MASEITSGEKADPNLISILVCPACRGELRFDRAGIECQVCGNSFAFQDGVPVFLPHLAEVAREHISNLMGPAFEALLNDGEEFTLHLGAGGSASRYPNCVEFEHKIFRHTDVVGDAHRLPFREGTFDRVLALNVFEHLRDPKTAASEILRVLKPGGGVTIHTAFLQPLHEAPNHFYNATEFGVREWFTAFEIESCQVSGNFAPGMMLAFLAANVLEATASGGATLEQQQEIGATTLGQWEEFWRNRNAPPPGFATLQNLPQSSQGRVAAGFELIGRKPVGPLDANRPPTS